MINLFFRNKQKQFNSIEEIFNALLSYINKNTKTAKVEVPYPGASLKVILKNIAFAKQYRQNINHITGHINYIALATGKNTILTIHDVGSNIYGNPIKQLLLKLFWFWLPAIFCKRITVISEFSKKQLSEIIPFAKSKIVVIPNPVKKELSYTPKVFNKDKPLILHLGTKSNKNLDRTVKAIKDLPCQLMIIGQLTSEQKELLEQNKIDYSNKYHIPYSEIIKAYQECDIVSFVSTYEGFGMPIIEAQAIGRPVITSNCCSMPEVAGNGASLVNPMNINEIKQGILKIIKDDKFRNQLISNGLVNIERFKLEKIANQYLDLYNEVKD